jgi:hypothetical protein
LKWCFKESHKRGNQDHSDYRSASPGRPWWKLRHRVEDDELDMWGPGLHAADRRNLQKYTFRGNGRGLESPFWVFAVAWEARGWLCGAGAHCRLAAAAGEARRNRARCCCSPPLGTTLMKPTKQHPHQERSLARSLRFRLRIRPCSVKIWMPDG